MSILNGEATMAKEGERRLANAVLMQAVNDAANPKYGADDAKLFLFGNGVWESARKVWCEAAGLPIEYFERSLKALSQPEQGGFAAAVSNKKKEIAARGEAGKNSRKG